MRCRECGLELDERDLLRNGAYQCPECGTIHHTASSRKASPSPWRRQQRRRSAFAAGDVLTRKYWLLPLWSYIAILLVVLIAAILLLTPGSQKSAPANPEMPAAEDTPLIETQTSPEDAAEGDADTGDADGGETENAVSSSPEAPATDGHTGISADDFAVSFDWAMNSLKYTSALSLVSNETNASGEGVRRYEYEDWFSVVLTIDTNTSRVRHAIATVSAAESNADSQRMLAAFVTTLYCFDTTLKATKGLSELNGMLADNVRTYGTSAFVAKVDSSNASGYTLEISGKL